MEKTDAETMTDAEINVLLDRFDQTEPALQRRIIAQFVVNSLVSEAQYHHVMLTLRNSRMPHDGCRQSNGCVACQAKQSLDEMLKEYGTVR